MTRVTLVTNDEGGFDAVDESGSVVASGTLELDLTRGAQRHGSLVFVTPLTEDQQQEAGLSEAGLPVRSQA